MATSVALAIEPPPLSPPPNGLLKSAPVVDHDGTDSHWMNGVTFSPESCADAIVFDPCSANPGDTVFSVADGVTNSTTTVTSATAAFRATDVGKQVTGAGIPAGATITAVNSATSITISAAATASATGVTVGILGRSPKSNRSASAVFLPFGVDAYDVCSAFGYERADYEGRARRALAVKETTAVENEFWTGAKISANRHLQDSNTANTTVLSGGTARGLRTALSALVQGISDYRLGQGMIHARPFLVTAWTALNMLRYGQDGKLYTLTGSLVVPGTGYTGAKPDGTAATFLSEWAYATELVQIHRGPVEVFAGESDRAATLDRANNTVTVRAQRMYSAVFNACAVLAINVDTTSSS